jgi:peptidoglycan L-alanyl-D-glutamate endopeptidase CwlK
MNVAADNLKFITDLQTWLNESRGERLKVDGHAGGLTRAAVARHFSGFGQAAAVVSDPAKRETARIVLPPPVVGGLVDERSEKNLITLCPEVQPVAREFIRQCHAKGWDFRITSGTRTYEQQERLYRQAIDGLDNDKDGKVDESDERVTKARAGYSNHNFGIAIDITLFDESTPVWESLLYREVARVGKALGFEWGGDWSSFKDLPHYQYRPQWARSMTEADMLAEFRRRVARNEPIFG